MRLWVAFTFFFTPFCISTGVKSTRVFQMPKPLVRQAPHPYGGSYASVRARPAAGVEACGQLGRWENLGPHRSSVPTQPATQQVGEQRPSEPAGTWEPRAVAFAACAVCSTADGGGSAGPTDTSTSQGEETTRGRRRPAVPQAAATGAGFTKALEAGTLPLTQAGAFLAMATNSPTFDKVLSAPSQPP